MEVTKSFRDEIYRARTLTRSDVASEIKSILSDIALDIDLTYPALSEESENLLNEVIIEIARNTRKHSLANSFYIKFDLTDSGFLLLLGDDGSGAINFKKSATDNVSFGLRGLDELLKVIASDYQCISDKSGTHFRIAFSLQSAQ
jgi:signal transduction histidine kinase